jgi:hypothetical protein
MRLMPSFFRVPTLAFLIVLFLVGCGKSPEEELHGLWKEQGGKETTIEFFDDGTFAATKEGESMDGKWSILGDGRIKYEISTFGMTGTQVEELDFEDGRAIFTTSKGDIQRYKRQ